MALTVLNLHYYVHQRDTRFGKTDCCQSVRLPSLIVVYTLQHSRDLPSCDANGCTCHPCSRGFVEELSKHCLMLHVSLTGCGNASDLWRCVECLKVQYRNGRSNGKSDKSCLKAPFVLSLNNLLRQFMHLPKVHYSPCPPDLLHERENRKVYRVELRQPSRRAVQSTTVSRSLFDQRLPAIVVPGISSNGSKCLSRVPFA